MSLSRNNSIELELLDYFIQYLRDHSSKTDATITNIHRDLSKFINHLELNQEELSANSIREYMSVLEEQYPESSYISKLSSLRQFTNWLNLEDNPFWRFKVKSSDIKDSYDQEFLHGLWGQEFDYDKFLLRFMYEFYLSIQELCDLNLAAYNKASNKIWIRGSWLEVPSGLPLKWYLTDYRPSLVKNSSNLQDPLLVSSEGLRFKTFDVLKILRQYSIKNTKLKRSRILHWVDQGLNIEQINQALALRLSDNYGSPDYEYRLLPSYSKFHPRAN